MIRIYYWPNKLSNSNYQIITAETCVYFMYQYMIWWRHGIYYHAQFGFMEINYIHTYITYNITLFNILHTVYFGWRVDFSICENNTLVPHPHPIANTDICSEKQINVFPFSKEIRTGWADVWFAEIWPVGQSANESCLMSIWSIYWENKNVQAQSCNTKVSFFLSFEFQFR